MDLDRLPTSSPRAFFALVCLGFACCFSTSPLGSIGTAALLQHASGWEEVLLARVVFLACCGAASYTVGRWTYAARGLPQVGAVGAALVALYLGGSGWNLWVYGALLGAGIGGFMPGWIERFAAIHQRWGRMPCVVAFSCAFLCSTAFSGLVGTMATGELASSCIIGACAVGTETCFALTSLGKQPAITRKGPFRPTRYTRALIASLGVTWALAFNLAPSLGFGSPRGGASLVVTLLTYALCQATVVIFVWKAGMAHVHFGLILRWIIAIIGIAWSFMPILVTMVPFVGCLTSVVVFLIQSVVACLFAIELARESRMPLTAVFRRLALTFVEAACVASGLFWVIHRFADPAIAASLVTAVAIIASVGILPLLPSRTSTAGVFTLELPPEDETVDARLEQARRIIVHGYGLTPREAQVFEQLVQGFNRDEIAERLSISVWTVKNHTRAIYVKTQTHSVQELMALVFEGATAARVP